MTFTRNFHVRVYADMRELANGVVRRIEAVAKMCHAKRRPLVLGLAAGQSPMGVYQLLVEQVRLGHLDLSNCIAFGLDEYYPVFPNQTQRFSIQLTRLATVLGIQNHNIHLLNGETPPNEIDAHCRQFEALIHAAGGIEFQILGVGLTGHIAFNEPGASRDSRTRRVELSEITRQTVQEAFKTVGATPKEALTMGIASILEAKEIAMLAIGKHKSKILQRIVESPPSIMTPASFLLSHPRTVIYADSAAAQLLNRQRADVTWFPSPLK